MPCTELLLNKSLWTLKLIIKNRGRPNRSVDLGEKYAVSCSKSGTRFIQISKIGNYQDSGYP